MEHLTQLQPIALIPTQMGVGLFLGTDQKVIVFYIEPGAAASIASVMEGTPAPRPLAHDLLKEILDAHESTLERVVIESMKDEVYYAKLFIKGEFTHQLQIDSRPSDSIALALRYKAPICIINELWEQLDDMSHELEALIENHPTTQ